jgi:hypothetical protein
MELSYFNPGSMSGDNDQYIWLVRRFKSSSRDAAKPLAQELD